MFNRPPKTLVIGKKSFIGGACLATYRQFYPDTIGTHYSPKEENHLDLMNPDLFSLKLKGKKYTHILIAGGCTSPAICEKDKEYTRQCNVYGTLQLVKQALALDMFPILFSTTYVFDGEQGPYTEKSSTNPSNEYGKQKVMLEQEIAHLCKDQFLILRCDKVFDLAPKSNTLLHKISSQLFENQPMFAASDRIFAPILLQDVVHIILALQRNKCKGLYNVCGKEIWSWLNLTQAIAAQIKAPPSLVIPSLLNQIPSTYKIPKRTDCLCDKLKNIIDYNLYPLSSCIQSLGNYKDHAR